MAFYQGNASSGFGMGQAYGQSLSNKSHLENMSKITKFDGIGNMITTGLGYLLGGAGGAKMALGASKGGGVKPQDVVGNAGAGGNAGGSFFNQTGAEQDFAKGFGFRG